MSEIKKGGHYSAKSKNRTIAQISILVVCFVMIVVLTIMFSSFSKKKQGQDYNNPDLVQRKLPSDDAPVVVFETTMGTFKAVIYEDKAPDFTDHFKKLVAEGYYNDTYVFRVEKGVYFMGGSKAPDGVDTDDTDKKTFDREVSADLWPFKGALVSYGGKSKNFVSTTVAGSRLMFVNSIEFTDDIKQEMKEAGGSEEVRKAFEELGGVPNFSKQYTIFGQVYDGFDVYEKISSSKPASSDDPKPSEEIKFKKVYMSTYGENKNDSFFPNK